MENIKDILAQCEMTPSDDCWDKLNNRLDAVLPQNTPSTAQQTGTASKGSIITHPAAWSSGAKIATALLGTAVVASTISFAIIKNRPTENNSNAHSIQTEKTIEQSESKDIINYKEEVELQKNRTISSLETEESTIVTEPTQTVFTDHNVVEQINKPSTAVANTQPAPTPTPIKSTIEPTVNLAKPTVSHTQQANVTQNISNDPVVQNLPEDAIDWNPPAKLEIPNVFTPNSDGVNDLFVILGLENCTKRQLIVYNRDGKVVFRSNSYENNWDGSNCPDGTYKYKFFYSSNGIEQSMSGIVHIVRK